MKFKAKEIFTIPNIMTYIRLICVPIFLWLMFDKTVPHHIYIALGVFAFATFTDFLDGKIARAFNMVSDIGKVTDPLADKLLQIAAILSLSIIGRVHWAFVVILLLKELYMILGGVVILKGFKSSFTIEANWVGKVGTMINSLGFFLAFFHTPEFKNLFYIDWVIIGIGCVFAIFGAYQYTKSFFDFRKKELAATVVGSQDESCSDDKTNEEM